MGAIVMMSGLVLMAVVIALIDWNDRRRERKMKKTSAQ